MAKLMKMLQPLQSEYVDRRFEGTKEEYFRALELSATLYIGNLSFFTADDQIYELFGKVGVVHRVIMGLDRNTKTPCGFCFVTYHTRRDALAACKYLNGTKLDNRQLRVDIDYGFEEGRQFGRGRSGGQVRDEFRTDFDADRGGFGRVVAQQLAAQQMAMWQEVQAGSLMMGAAGLPGGDAVFFSQMQRELLGQGQGQATEGDAAAAAAADVAASTDAAVNPRMRGREDDDDDADAERRRQNKRRRVGSAAGAGGQDAAAAAAAAAEADAAPEHDAGGDDEMQAAGGDSEQQEAGDEEEQQQQQQEEEEEEEPDDN